jgi:hypothetical protein
MGRGWRGPARLGVAAVLTAVAAALALLATHWDGGPPQAMAGVERHCFAEWCIAPVSAAAGAGSVSVQVEVTSTARAASQRPDHPQAWLALDSGRQAGGPQPALDRQVGPGESFRTVLVFKIAGGCPALIVSEGGWPPFLGLGYAPSPFTARARWRVCDIPPAAT